LFGQIYKDQEHGLDEIKAEQNLERARKGLIDWWKPLEGLACGERAKQERQSPKDWLPTELYRLSVL
jgi:hypothetical protein